MRPGRQPGWDVQLATYVRDGMSLSFAWGRHDCCLWAAGWVDLATGTKIHRAFAGRYDDLKGALRLVREAGGLASLTSLALAGTPIMEPLKAIRGDIAIVPGAYQIDAVGIILGRQVAVLTPDGLEGVPVSQVITAWAIG